MADVQAVAACNMALLPIQYLNGSISYDTAFYGDMATGGTQIVLDCISPPDSHGGVPITSQGGSIMTGESCPRELLLWILDF